MTASADEHPDLFWALRGGGGNFGVVTALEYRLHPVGPVVLGGLMLFAPETGRELTRHWSDFMQAAPDEVGGALVGVTAPAAGFIPAPLRGRPAFGIVAAYFGSIERGREALRPLREQIAPAVDLVAPLPYIALQQLLDPMNPPRPAAVLEIRATCPRWETLRSKSGSSTACAPSSPLHTGRARAPQRCLRARR